MRWTFAPQPGSVHLAAVAHDAAEWDRIVAMPEARFDGQRATLVRHECHRDHLWLRFLLDEPFRMPPTVIRFEDVEVAERIVATGWYSFEGGLYRALPGDEPGAVVLDRVYAADPPPTYEGRPMPGTDAEAPKRRWPPIPPTLTALAVSLVALAGSLTNTLDLVSA